MLETGRNHAVDEEAEQFSSHSEQPPRLAAKRVLCQCANNQGAGLVFLNKWGIRVFICLSPQGEL